VGLKFIWPLPLKKLKWTTLFDNRTIYYIDKLYMIMQEKLFPEGRTAGGGVSSMTMISVYV